MANYVLSRDAHLCVTDDHGVILDLRRDRYLGIGPAEMRALSEVVLDWPRMEHPSTQFAREKSESITSLIAHLVETGLITKDGAKGKPAAPVRLDRPTCSLMHWAPEEHLSVRASHVANVAAASATAAVLLRLYPISRVVQRVHRRKVKSAAEQIAHDPASARELTAIFLKLGPLFFSEQNRCLFSSLALIEFLARYAIFPQWVFGIQTRPFAAHCWVQQETTVFNSTSEFALAFTPIMVI